MWHVLTSSRVQLLLRTTLTVQILTIHILLRPHPKGIFKEILESLNSPTHYIAQSVVNPFLNPVANPFLNP